MTFEIIWSEKAISDLEDIIKHLDLEWGIKTTANFKKRLGQRLHLISKFPKLHNASRIKPISKIGFKQTSINHLFSRKRCGYDCSIVGQQK